MRVTLLKSLTRAGRNSGTFSTEKRTIGGGKGGKGGRPPHPATSGPLGVGELRVSLYSCRREEVGRVPAGKGLRVVPRHVKAAGEIGKNELDK